MGLKNQRSPLFVHVVFHTLTISVYVVANIGNSVKQIHVQQGWFISTLIPLLVNSGYIYLCNYTAIILCWVWVLRSITNNSFESLTNRSGNSKNHLSLHKKCCLIWVFTPHYKVTNPFEKVSSCIFYLMILITNLFLHF